MTFPLPTETRLSPSDDADGESREQGFDKAESLGKRRGGGAGGGEEKPFSRKVSLPPIRSLLLHPHPRRRALRRAEQQGPVVGAEQEILHLLVRDGVQFAGAVEVEGRAEGDPDEQHDPRLHADGGGGTGQRQHGETENRGQPADDRHGPAPAGFGNRVEVGDVLVGRHAGEEIGEGRAHGRHVHDPVQGRTPEPRGDERQAQREQHRVGRRAVLGMYPDEPRMQELAAPHAEQQARGGHEEAVHAREDARHDRDGEDRAAELAEGHVRDRARGPTVVLAEQIGVGHDDGDREEHQRVQGRAADDGIDHQAAGLFGREVELLGGLRNGVESHEQPRGDRKDGDHAGPRGPAFREQGPQVVEAGRVRGRRTDGQHEHAAREGEGEDQLEAAGEVHAPEVHVAEKEEEGRHHGQFARVDVPSRDRVHVPHVEDAGQDEAAQQREGRSVGGDDAQIPEHQRPAADEARPRPEPDVGVGEGTARYGVDLDQNAVTERHRTQKPAAEGERDAGAERPGFGQETGLFL